MATTNLILNITNYNNSTITNGKVYSTGVDYACNYPLDMNTAFSIDTTNTSKIITCTVGDFTDLLGCDIQNNNVPVRKWVTAITGEVLEIDYINSPTEAVLKMPCSFTLIGGEFYTVDYWGSPQVEDTIIQNTDDFPVVGLLINTNIGPIVTNVASGQSIGMGQNPISVDLGNTGVLCNLIVKYIN